MSKPIKLTDELLKKLQEEFTENLKKMKMFDGEIKYTKKLKWSSGENDKATVIFYPLAYAKMIMLIQSFSEEVAWHGICGRDADNSTVFYIKDIIVYPQVVTTGTVNTDQEEYQEWLFGLDDHYFENNRMQGHSHVNFSTSPSTVDEAHQEAILANVPDDDYYIFMIWNKKNEHTVKIYDLKTNTLYEDNDIVIKIGDKNDSMDDFLNNAKKIVRRRTYQYQELKARTQEEQKLDDNKKEKIEKPAIGFGWKGKKAEKKESAAQKKR